MIHKHLKLYQATDKDYLKIQLKKLKVMDAETVLKKADDYIELNFFEMTGIAKQSQLGDIILPTEVLGHIVSYLEFSDIL